MESIQWNISFVDLVGPFKIRREAGDKPLILEALTIVDPATRRLKIRRYKIYRKI